MFKKGIAAFLILLLVFVTACSNGDGETNADTDEDGIKVGVLFSLSGATAITEAPQANAALLAIEEINNNGGINGKKLIPVQEDYNSDPTEAATKASKLILDDEVVAIVGTHTSASRQAALPVVEENNSVLLYPVLFEGEEYSRNIIYTGTTPNQQLESFIPWVTENLGKKVYLLGSDYIYPVQTNNIVKKLLELEGGEVVGEQYVPLGHSEFSSVINDIRQSKPDVIFSALAGDSISSFYNQYADYGLDAETMPIVSPTTMETDLAAISNDAAKGHYGSQPYFETIDTPENQEFVKAYHEKFGEDEPISAVIEAAYTSVHLLAKALEKVEDPYDADALLEAFIGLEFNAPQGTVTIDENNHTYLFSRIGQVNENGEYEVIFESNEAIKPEPWSKLLFPDHEEPWK